MRLTTHHKAIDTFKMIGHRSHRSRLTSGSALLIVLILATIASIGIMTFLSATSQETNRTMRIVQHTRAQYLARRAVARVAGIVNQKPWSDRFFQENAVQLSSHEGLLRETEGILRDGEYYEGTVQQVSAQGKRYRVKLRVVFPSGSLGRPDYRHTSSWDMQYSEGLLGALNRECILGSAESDDLDTPQDELDMQLDAIRNEARRGMKEPELAGNPGEAWIDDVLGGDATDEMAKVMMLSANPEETMQPPGWVDGTDQDGKDPLTSLLESLDQQDQTAEAAEEPVTVASAPPEESPEPEPEPEPQSSPSPSPSASPSPSPSPTPRVTPPPPYSDTLEMPLAMTTSADWLIRIQALKAAHPEASDYDVSDVQALHQTGLHTSAYDNTTGIVTYTDTLKDAEGNVVAKATYVYAYDGILISETIE